MARQPLIPRAPVKVEVSGAWAGTKFVAVSEPNLKALEGVFWNLMDLVNAHRCEEYEITKRTCAEVGGSVCFFCKVLSALVRKP